MAKYRIYPDNTIDEIDPYEDYDIIQPHYDDYEVYEISDKMLNELGIDVVAVEYWETPKSHCRYQPE